MAPQTPSNPPQNEADSTTGAPVSAAVDASADYAAPDYAPDPATRWGLPQFAAGLGLFVAILIVMNVAAILTPPEARGPLLFVAVLLGYGALFGTVFIASKRRGSGSLARDFGLRFRPVDLAIGLGVGIAAKIAGVIVAIPLVGLTGGVPTSNVPVENDLVWIVLNTVVATVLIAPFVEELFFRGLLLRAIRNGVLRGRASHPRAEAAGPKRVSAALLCSVLFSSVVFMIVHLYQAPDLTTLLVLGSSTLLLGLANAVLATRTGRLGPGIVAHMVFNGVALVGFFLVA